MVVRLIQNAIQQFKGFNDFEKNAERDVRQTFLQCVGGLRKYTSDKRLDWMG